MAAGVFIFGKGLDDLSAPEVIGDQNCHELQLDMQPEHGTVCCPSVVI